MWFYHSRRRRRYKRHIVFIVSRLSAEIQLKTSCLLIAMGNSIRNIYLGIVKRDWISIVCWRPNRKPFLSACSNIWNSKVVLYNKITCLLRCGCSNRDLWVVTPADYYISMLWKSVTALSEHFALFVAVY